MKKVIALFSGLLSGLLIAGGAAAQADRTGTTAAQPTNSVERQAPVGNDRDKRENPHREGPESANIVDPDFQGSSKQETTASGMGQPKKEDTRTSPADKTKPQVQDTQDVEDKTKK